MQSCLSRARQHAVKSAEAEPSLDPRPLLCERACCCMSTCMRRVFALMCMMMMIYICVSEVGGSETNRAIVSVRSHARTRGLVVRSELGKKKLGLVAFPFPFGRRRVILWSFGGVLVNSSEFK